jgi:Flp pilus assembly protein TadD
MMFLRTSLIVSAILAFGLAGCARGPRPDVVGAQRSLANELIKQHDFSRAFAVADALCRNSPREPDGYLLRGIIYREQRLLSEAEGDLKEAVRLAPKSARAHSALAILHDALASTEDALEHHRRAVKLEPNDPQYLNNLGFSLFAHGKAREAVETLQRAVRAAPADPRIRNNLGFAFAATGDLTRAAEQFAFGGTPAVAKTNLGWAYERRGSLVQAFELYVEALRLDPAATSARKNLTRVARDLGRSPPADVATPPGA